MAFTVSFVIFIFIWLTILTHKRVQQRAEIKKLRKILKYYIYKVDELNIKLDGKKEENTTQEAPDDTGDEPAKSSA